jgi:hypothetical protein
MVLMEGRSQRRPVWEPGALSRIITSAKRLLKQITFARAILAVVVLPLLFYIYREVSHDALIIDPFSVPKSFEEAGLTSDVVAIGSVKQCAKLKQQHKPA